MSKLEYEHHFNVREDKLCPFLLRHVKNYNSSAFNWHENIELITITKGSGFINYGDRKFDVSPGDMVIINSGTLHGISSDEDLEYYYLIVDESFCNQNGISTVSRTFTPVFKSEETSRIFNNLVTEFFPYIKDKNNRSPFSAPRVRMAVLNLLLDICQNHTEAEVSPSSTAKPSEEYVKKVTDYISNRFKQPLTLEKLAEKCGISKHHLAREFKRYTGQTVTTYINTIRCKNAKIYLNDGMTVTDVAFECGFESVSYFSRTYKKIMGVSPSQTPKK